MTDRQLAEALTQAQQVETAARQSLAGLQADDLAERDGALVVMRHATALRKSCEVWLSARACRAALHSVSSNTP